ncbi:MAG: hypothetical protein P8176_01465 [Gammaproteobacteria bacterium]
MIGTFILEKSFLFSEHTKEDERKIKDFPRMNYFSFDFSFSSLNLISSKFASALGWSDRISVYTSGDTPFDFKERAARQDMIPVSAEDELISHQVLKL